MKSKLINPLPVEVNRINFKLNNIMYTLTILTFNGEKSLVFTQTIKQNGYTTVIDMQNNKLDVHSSLLTDLTNYPDQQQQALKQHPFKNLRNL